MEKQSTRIPFRFSVFRRPKLHTGCSVDIIVSNSRLIVFLNVASRFAFAFASLSLCVQMPAKKGAAGSKRKAEADAKVEATDASAANSKAADGAKKVASSASASASAKPSVVFATPPSPSLAGKRKPIRVWIDGCFDLMHWGHANAIRQAKELCDYLVVGVHSDADILRHKGPPVMTEQERYRAVRACKWVDEVVEAAPYVTELSVLDTHNIDFCVHGEDVSTDEHGRDCYWEVKEAGRYKTIKRSESVSTTDIVGRMLLMTKDHLSKSLDNSQALQQAKGSVPVSQVLSTTNRIVQFGSTAGTNTARKRSGAQAGDTVIYIDGAFDLFHVGHIEALCEARKLVPANANPYLIVGVHDDGVVNHVKGGNLPIMNLHERVLSVLACRYVDEVVIGAPWAVTKQILSAMKIDVVAHGTASDYTANNAKPPDAYDLPRELGLYREFKSTHPTLTTTTLVERILENRLLFIERNRKKQGKEKAAGNAVTDNANANTAAAAALSTGTASASASSSAAAAAKK